MRWRPELTGLKTDRPPEKWASFVVVVLVTIAIVFGIQNRVNQQKIKRLSRQIEIIKSIIAQDIKPGQATWLGEIIGADLDPRLRDLVGHIIRVREDSDGLTDLDRLEIDRRIEEILTNAKNP